MKIVRCAMPDITEMVMWVFAAAVGLLIVKVFYCWLKKKRKDHQPHISFMDVEGNRVAVLHTQVIPKLDDLDKLFNQALDRLAIDGDVSDEDYSLALAAYQKFKKERNV